MIYKVILCRKQDVKHPAAFSRNIQPIAINKQAHLRPNLSRAEPFKTHILQVRAQQGSEFSMRVVQVRFNGTL